MEQESFYNAGGATLTTAQEIIVLAQSMTAAAKRMTALSKRARVIELRHKKLSIEHQHSKTYCLGDHAGAESMLAIAAPGDAAVQPHGGDSFTAQPPSFPPPASMMSRSFHAASTHAFSSTDAVRGHGDKQFVIGARASRQPRSGRQHGCHEQDRKQSRGGHPLLPEVCC